MLLLGFDYSHSPQPIHSWYAMIPGYDTTKYVNDAFSTRIIDGKDGTFEFFADLASDDIFA